MRDPSDYVDAPGVAGRSGGRIEVEPERHVRSMRSEPLLVNARLPDGVAATAMVATARAAAAHRRPYIGLALALRRPCIG